MQGLIIEEKNHQQAMLDFLWIFPHFSWLCPASESSFRDVFHTNLLTPLMYSFPLWSGGSYLLRNLSQDIHQWLKIYLINRVSLE